MIEVSHLVKRYGDTAAVDDLSFTVEKGQIYGFLGPNGAGKSTTMNILTGYIAPTAGTILINGHNILEEPEEARKSIGYLPEIPPVYPEMTVTEYLVYAAGLKKLPRKERSRMIDEAMEQTGLLEVRERLIKNLSKGYRQRVGLAQAILGSPQIIILDEPMVGLDPKQIIEIRELIRSLSKEHTVILSSHILSEISAICDHILIIAHGKLAASDTPDNLTRLMQGTGTLELTIKGKQTEIEMMLQAVDRIKQKKVAVSDETGAFDVEIQTGGDVDLREQLFELCAERKLPILRMQQSKASLEDVFLELTGEGADKNEELQEEPSQKRKWKLSGRRKEEISELDIDNQKDEVISDVEKREKQNETEKEEAES